LGTLERLSVEEMSGDTRLEREAIAVDTEAETGMGDVGREEAKGGPLWSGPAAKQDLSLVGRRGHWVEG
jgi:hypothetical protein